MGAFILPPGAAPRRWGLLPIILAALVLTVGIVALWTFWPRRAEVAKPSQPPQPAQEEAAGRRPLNTQSPGQAVVGPVLGIVDTVRVLNESARALFYQQRLDEREKAMAAELETLAKSLPRKELEARRERALAELQELKSDMERQLNEEIRATVARVASQRGLAGVLVRGPAVYWVPGAVVDITDEIITALK